jgi:hypothetical protein
MLADVSTETLRKLVKLSERKEALMAQIQKIDREMLALQRTPTSKGNLRGARAGRRVSPKPRRSASADASRGKRGALKASILEALRVAGSGGTTIRELSEQLRVKPANLYVWFNGTGKNVAGLRKIGPAKYRLNG